jgi:hypothetical protein
VQVDWRQGKEFRSRERENVLGLSFVVDIGKAVMWWNSETKVGRAALCWELGFDVETIAKLGHRFSSRSRIKKSHGRTVLLQSESTFLSLCSLFPKERPFCWKNLGSSVCPRVKSTVEDESEGPG